MVQYVCRFCSGIVTYGEYHPCVFNKNTDNVYSRPRLDEKDKSSDDAKDNLMVNSAKLFSNVQQNESKKSQHVHSLPIKKRYRYLATPFSISDGTAQITILRNPHDASRLSTTLNARANEEHSDKKASLKTTADNVEPDCISEKYFLSTYKGTSIVTRSNYEQSGSKTSNFFQEKVVDECGMSLEERKQQSFDKGEVNYIDALASVIKNAFPDNKNSHETSNFIDNKNSYENAEPDCILEKYFRSTYKGTSIVTGSNYEHSGSKTSNIYREKFVDECGVSLEERKKQSFNMGEVNYIDALASVIKNALPDNKNCHETSNFRDNSNLLSFNEQPNNYMIGLLGDQKENIFPEEPSEIQNNAE